MQKLLRQRSLKKRQRLFLPAWVLLFTSIPSLGSGQSQAPVRDYSRLSLVELEALQPEWPNPYLSFLPAEARPDRRYWDAVMAARAREGMLRLPANAARTVLLTKTEPNGTAGTANAAPGFGTGAGEDPAADFTATERFAGTEDTLAVVACGCTGGRLFADGFESGTTGAWYVVVP